MEYYEMLVNLWNNREGYSRDIAIKMHAFRLGLKAVGITTFNIHGEDGKIREVRCILEDKIIFRWEVK